MRTLRMNCPKCGTEFGQPDDPGKRRTYCTNACRQSAYRDRVKEQRQEQQAHEQKQRQQSREESSQRRQQRRRRQESYGTPHDWWSPRTTDDSAQAKARATCARLMERAEHGKTTEHEAAACREKAAHIREKRGL